MTAPAHNATPNATPAAPPAAAADDPTHALDDFVRRMRPATSPPAPDEDPTSLAGLHARLHPERAPDGGHAPVGQTRSGGTRKGVLRTGQTWDADDVVDVVDATELRLRPTTPTPAPAPSDPPTLTLPTVDLAAEQRASANAPDLAWPEVAAPAGVDTADLDLAMQQASSRASAQFTAEEQATTAPAWQPDLQALQLRRAAHPRVLNGWQPGAWTGAVREVLAATTEFVTAAGGTVVESYPPHRLLLLWPPQRLDAPLLGRWPQRVWLSAVPADAATEALLDQVPGTARLWLHLQAEDIDWALAAEIVLTHEPALRPFQAKGLRAFIDAEREAGFARLNSAYQAAPGGARLG